MVCVCVCVDVYMVAKRKRSLLSHYFMFSRLLWPTCFSTHSSQWFGHHTKLALYLRMHLNLNVAVVLLVFNAHFLVCSCVFVCVCVVLFRLCPFLFWFRWLTFIALFWWRVISYGFLLALHLRECAGAWAQPFSVNILWSCFAICHRISWDAVGRAMQIVVRQRVF